MFLFYILVIIKALESVRRFVTLSETFNLLFFLHIFHVALVLNLATVKSKVGFRTTDIKVLREVYLVHFSGEQCLKAFHYF